MDSGSAARRYCFWRKAVAGSACVGSPQRSWRRASGHASVRVDWQGIRRSTTLDTDMFSYPDGPERNLRRVTNRRAIET